MRFVPRFDRFRVRAPLVVIALLISLGTAAPARAQFASTASVEGNVTDESMAALPGVTITLSSPALQLGQVTDVTNTEGHYRFTQLPLGTYQIRYELSGFQPMLREGLILSQGFAAKVDVSLKIGSVQETITVTGASPIVDVSTTATGTSLSPAQVNNLPSSRMYGDMSRMVSAMRTTSAPNIGRIGFGASGGANAYGNTTTILRLDGVEVLGNTYPDFATAQEVEIKSAGTSPEVNQAGSVWNLVTKSGGNQTHGRLGETYINGKHGLQANNVDDKLRAQGLSNADSVIWFTDFTGDLGGKVIPDRLWFYGGYRRRQNERTAAGEVLRADPVCGCVTDNTPYIAPDHQDNYTGKLTYQLSPKYQVIALYAQDISINNGGVENSKGDRRYVPYESDMLERYDPHHFIGQFRATLRPNLLLNVNGSLSHYTFDAEDTPGNDTKTAWWDRNTKYFGGGSIGPASNYAVYIDPHHLDTTQAMLTFLPHDKILGGSHQFQVGGGTRFVGAGGRVPNHPAGNYQITYDVVNGVAHQPVEIQAFNFPINQPNRGTNGNGFINDKWELGSRLTLNLGIRFDHDHAYIPPLVKEQGQFGGSGSFPRIEGNTFDNWSPRLAAAYDITGDGKTVVKATYADYQGAGPSAAPYSLAGVTTTTYRFHDLNHDGMYQPGEVDLNLNGPDFISITGNGVATNIFNPDLQRSHEREFTGILDREIMANMAAHIVYVYREPMGTTQTVNVLRPYNAFNIPIQRRDPGPDGFVNTADDGPMVTIWDYDAAYRGAAFVGNEVLNRPDNRSNHFHNLEFTLARRASAKWSAQTSFLTTKNYVYAVGIPTSPNDDYYNIDRTWNWVYKVNGSYTFPRDIVFSGLFDVQPGIRGQRTYIFRAADPLGQSIALKQQTTVTLRLSNAGDYVGPTRASANLRLAKVFRFNQKELRAGVDLLNAFNSNAFWAMDFSSGPTFGYGTAFTNPRTLQFSGSFEF
jgi:carboxypeptidase family protein